jgi:hypothetical protein
MELGVIQRAENALGILKLRHQPHGVRLAQFEQFTDRQLVLAAMQALTELLDGEDE